MNRYVETLMITSSLVVFSGCSRTSMPSRVATVPSPPSIVDSDVNARVSVQLATLGSAIKAKVPTPLESGTTEMNLKANVQESFDQIVHDFVPHKISKTCWTKGTTGSLVPPVPPVPPAPYPCDIVEMIDTIRHVPGVRQITPNIKLDVSDEVNLTAVNLTMEKDRLQLVADADFSLALKAAPGIVKIGVASCGGGQVPPSLRLAESVTIGWKPDGHLSVDKQPWTLQWTNPCNLTFANVSLESVLNISGLKSKLDAVIDQKLSSLPSDFDLTAQVAKVWTDIQQPRLVVPGVWLAVNPNAANISVPYGANGAINFDVGMSCIPGIHYGEAPTNPLIATPTLTHVNNSSEFSIILEGDVSYLDVSKLLTKSLAAEDQDIAGHKVRISKVEVYPSGNVLAIGVTIVKPFKAVIWLTGKPVVDAAGDNISLDNVDYTVDAAAYLKAVDWMLHSNFQNKIQSKATFPLAKLMTKAKIALADYDGKKVGIAKLHIKARQISVASVYLMKDELRARLVLKGSASVDVQPKVDIVVASK